MNYLGILTTSEWYDQWIQNNLNIGLDLNLDAGIGGLVVVCRDVEIGSTRDNYDLGLSDGNSDRIGYRSTTVVREALACKSTSTSNSAIVSVYEMRKSWRDGLGLVWV